MSSRLRGLIQSCISLGPGKHILANRLIDKQIFYITWCPLLWTGPLFFVKKKLSFSGLASDSLVAIRQQIRRQHGPQGQDETMWSLDLPPLGPKDAILVTTKRYLHLPHLQKIMPFKLVSFSWINFGIKSYTQNEDPSRILFLGHCESPLKARFRKKHDWHPGESSWGGRSKAPPAKKSGGMSLSRSLGWKSREVATWKFPSTLKPPQWTGPQLTLSEHGNSRAAALQLRKQKLWISQLTQLPLNNKNHDHKKNAIFMIWTWTTIDYQKKQPIQSPFLPW